MHQIHTTAGFIIFSRPYGEADKLISIFTRDFGLVTATARGIRLEKSKLRYHAQDYSLGVFSLVRGKEFWRLTSTSVDDLTPASLFVSAGSRHSTKRDAFAPSSTDVHHLFVRIAQLLKRFLQGEEPHPELFECIGSVVNFLNEFGSTMNDEQLKTLESIAVLRILNLLGYIGKVSSFEESFLNLPVSASLLDQGLLKRPLINQHINKALRESHL